MKSLTVPVFCLVSILAGTATAAAQEKKEAVKPVALWPDGAPGAKGTEPRDIPTAKVYLPAKDKANGAAAVICPGGGYGGLADHEGLPIAAWLNKHGVAGIVLTYRLGPKYNHPIELHDAQRALRYTRAHATEWGIDAGRVGILGFSAGGHLASTAGTHFDRGLADAKDPVDKLSCRPDFMVLLYPVITLTDQYTHKGSRNNLLGKNPDPQLVESLSNDRQVTKDTPPTFLVHTSADTAVPPENSVLFYLALSKHKVPAEMHIYEKGRHGLGLGTADLPFASWPDRCIAWMQSRGLLGKKE
ncbi:MAG TPA: alpha/beta hydrolase [Gemmataceae bacterium]|jgi:acetyl esterase/lipase|nr:alpha/beta hydrolase [Gemmataceae bacterium]